jgi:phage tail protein X
MSSPYISYTTQVNDRWDLLAWRFYGDATQYGPIIQANPAVPVVGVFGAGVELQIPILQIATDVSNNLPPWETL